LQTSSKWLWKEKVMGYNETKAGAEKELRVLLRRANRLNEEGNIPEVIQVQNLKFHSQRRAMVAKAVLPGLDRG
jgi:hypothetical protein